MATLVLTLNGANGKPNDWNHVLVPFLQIQAFLNNTGLSSTNIQNNSIVWNKIRENEGLKGMRIKVRNTTAATITADTLLYFSGEYNDGTTTYPIVSKAVVTQTATTTFICQGCAEADIAPSSDGTLAMIKQFDSVSVANVLVNQPVYLDRTAGGWTSVQPASPNISQVVGRVSVSSTDGQIMFNAMDTAGLERFITSSGAGLTGITDNTTGPVITLNDTTMTFGQQSGGARNATYSTTGWVLDAIDRGAGTSGRRVVIGRNSNATNPAGGLVEFKTLGDTSVYLHVDTSNVPRMGTTLPTNANDTTNAKLLLTGILDTSTTTTMWLRPSNIDFAISGTAVGSWTATRFTMGNPGHTLYLNRSGGVWGGSAESNSLIIQHAANSTSSAGMQFVTGTAGDANIWFGDTGNGEAGSISYWHSGNTMVFKADGGNFASINGSSAAFGTSVPFPGSILSVINGGGAATSPASGAQHFYINNNSGDTGMTIGSGGANLLSIKFAETGDASAGTIQFNIANDSLKLWTKANSNQLVLDSTGRVAIGTTGPEEALEINAVEPTILLWAQDSTIALDQDVGGLEWQQEDNFGVGNPPITRRASFKATAMTSDGGFRLRMNFAAPATSLGFSQAFEANHLLDVVLARTGGIGSAATTGRPWIPASTGTPTGTPGQVYTGSVPMQYDSATNELYIWNSGWRSVALT